MVSKPTRASASFSKVIRARSLASSSRQASAVQELARRTDTLIRLVEKEQEDYDAVDVDEPKVRSMT